MKTKRIGARDSETTRRASPKLATKMSIPPPNLPGAYESAMSHPEKHV